MSDTPEQSSIDVTRAVHAHVRQIIEAAEQAAAELRDQVEQESLKRAREIRAHVDVEAARIRAEANAEAERYLEDARRRIDAFAQGRVQRITDLTDTLASHAAAIDARMDEVLSMQTSLKDLIDALQLAARTAAAEGARPPIRLEKLTAEGTEEPS